MSEGRLYDDDRPEAFPVYRVAVTVELESGRERAVAGLKTTGLDVHFGDGRNQLYDLEGRLLRVATPDVQWRRGLSHRTIQLRKRTRSQGGGFERRMLSGLEADQIVSDASCRMSRVEQSFRAGRWSAESGEREPELLTELGAAMLRAARFDAAAACDDLARFRAIYGDVPILPPDQYTSLVLLATEGCRYNRCTFCGFYRGAQYRERTLDEFRAHMKEAMDYHRGGLAMRRSVFLGQANALMGPRTWREAILRAVNESFELPPGDQGLPSASWWKGSPRRFNGITAFLDAFVGVRIDAHEFAAMRQLNLRQVFIGMESGDPELLKWLRKPADPRQVLDTVVAAKAGGVHVGVIVLIGAGGERFFDCHVEHTVALIREMQLQPGDFIYLSPLIDVSGAEYATLAAAEHVEPLSPARLAEQERLIRAGLGVSPARNGPYVAHYEVANFVY